MQVLKRYYEEFSKLKAASPDKDPKELSRLAIVSAMTRIGPVMIVACTVAALGFFSLYVFEIKSVQTFGILTGIGVLSAMVLEFTLIPALRSALKPPGDKERRREQERTFWDRLLEGIYYLVLQRRWVITLITVAFLGCVFRLGGLPPEIREFDRSNSSTALTRSSRTTTRSTPAWPDRTRSTSLSTRASTTE